MKVGARLAAALLLLSPASADQPIKCTSKEDFMGGVWNFHVSPHQETVDLFAQSEVCTHQVPNRVQIIAEDYQFEMYPQTLWKVMIYDFTTVKAKNCKGLDEDQCMSEINDGLGVVKGTWNIYFSQALVVELDNDMRFVANF